MRTNKICLALFFILALSGLVLAVPGIPHQFYGDVIVNDQPVPDNTVIVAEVGGDEYITVTKDGKYGYAPNIFYVEDPEGNRGYGVGELIEFYMGGMLVGSYNFENNGYTRLDFSVTTTCGDSYCLGDETCSSCSADCGVCTGPPVITIYSPINKIYDTLKVGLEVSSDQEIIVWMYALNSAEHITFTPNITLTAQKGSNSVTVVGINQAYQTGTSTVSFSVELSEYCGDGICNSGETCSTCATDCGVCPDNNGGSSSGSRSSSSSSSSNSLSLTGDDTNSESSDETSEEISVGAGMTGGVIGSSGSGTGIMLILTLIIIILGIGVVLITKKKSKS
jgi:hypothetical protein